MFLVALINEQIIRSPAHTECRPTKRAADWWDSARLTGIFLASGFFCSRSFVSSRPPAANANRWAARKALRVGDLQRDVSVFKSNLLERVACLNSPDSLELLSACIPSLGYPIIGHTFMPIIKTMWPSMGLILSSRLAAVCRIASNVLWKHGPSCTRENFWRIGNDYSLGNFRIG